MKQRFTKKLAIVFSVALVSVYGIMYACAGGDWDFDFKWSTNFAPETFADASYAPLFLSGDFFYEIGFDRDHNSRFNEQNIRDWQTYLKEKMTEKEIRFFLTDTSRQHVAGLDLYFKTKKQNAFSQLWYSRIDLKDKKTKSFIFFLNLAQQLETVSVSEERWSYEPVPKKTFSDAAVVKTIEKEYQTTKDPFLKNRYWFQTVKAYFYSNQEQNTFAFFNATKSDVPKNTLYYRAVGYIASLHYKAKNYATANYLYGLIFDKCPEMRVVAATSFHPQENTDWNQSLQMTKSAEEKAGLWALRGYYGDEQNAIEEIIKIQPSSPHLNYLLTRLINNQEQKIALTFKEKSLAENKKKQIAEVNQSTLNLVSKIANLPNTDNPFMWQLAKGYLQTLSGKYGQADACFDKATTQLPPTTLAKQQLRLLRFINNLSKIESITATNQKTILADLHWLYEELPKTAADKFRYNHAADWSKKYLATLFKDQNNAVMAELFSFSEYEIWGRGNAFYDNPKNLLDMKAFLLMKNKTELEQIAAEIYPLKVTDISNFQAVQATFQNKIPEAIAFMKENDSIGKKVFYGNPFNGTIKDCHDCDHLAYQKRKYTELNFLETIQLMQTKLEQKEEVYNNALLLGNAFYNISHFGNGRTFYEISIVGYGSSPTYFRAPMMQMIVDNSLSQKYYQQALAAAQTPEQKAKCVYLLAKCERNAFYNNRYYFQQKDYWDFYSDKTNFLAWNGFKQLQQHYRDTKYYQEVIRECGFFSTYVKQL
ncbi:hypothetical protein [Flavobacterium agrisoli]|uniref:Uncharacterized protein n=1 Tax=Flavobacterium agrisoli TaxID=2793066 RepID=A0A934UJS0_9FLAO|nr:hypothetical protein [Flavobacterium agrisoli]MBK0369798.1 hypothetical protein [Flavobacterium agrisoli]